MVEEGVGGECRGEGGGRALYIGRLWSKRAGWLIFGANFCRRRQEGLVEVTKVMVGGGRVHGGVKVKASMRPSKFTRNTTWPERPHKVREGQK